MKRPGQGWGRGRTRAGGRLASTATLLLHALLAFAVVASRPGTLRAPPPVYRVELVAAPLPEPEAKRAPDVVERPAPEPAPVPKKVESRKTSMAKTPPPPAPKPDVKREPAPRTKAPEEPARGVKPSTGTDVATVKTSGVDFAYPEYLRNLVAQVYRRWRRPTDNLTLQAEVMFLVRRDGSVSNLQFVQRSGNFGFDLEAQGAIEAAGNARAFGRLPDGYEADVLPVNFFFNPATAR